MAVRWSVCVDWQVDAVAGADERGGNADDPPQTTVAAGQAPTLEPP